MVCRIARPSSRPALRPLIALVWAAPVWAALAVAPSAQSVRLSTQAQPTVGDVTSHLQSPDGQWVVYLADQDADGLRELYSVPADGSAAPVKLDGAATSGNIGVPPALCQISPDSAHVVYGANDAGSGVFSLYAVPIAGGASVKLSGATALNSAGVEPFQISPDSTRVVYASNLRLYSVALAGGPSVQLSQSLQVGGLLVGFFYGRYAITPDSSRVVFASDEPGTNQLAVYCCAITGSAPVRLSTAPQDGYIGPLAIHPDGKRVVFLQARGIGQPERLSCATLDGSGRPLHLTSVRYRIENFQLTPGGERVLYITRGNGTSRQLFSARIPLHLRSTEPLLETLLTPPVAWNRTLFQYEIDAGGERVVLQTDQNVQGQLELFSTPIVGGPLTLLGSAPLGIGGLVTFRLAAEGGTVFFMSDVGGGTHHLFRVPVTGGASTQLTPAFVAGGSVSNFDPCEPLDRVVYRADQDTDGVQELYSVPEGGGLSLRLNPPLPLPLAVQEFGLASDGRVVYLADQTENEAVELYSVPATGGGAVKLNGTLVRDDVDDVASFLVDGPGAQALYLADEDADAWPEIYGAPLDGSAPAAKLGPPPTFLGLVGEYQLTPDGTSLVVLATNSGLGEVFTVALDGSTPPLRIATPPPSRSLSSVKVSPAGDRIVYYASQSTDKDLYSGTTDGSLAAVRLDNGESLSGFTIVDGGTRVVYVSTTSGYHLMSIPIDGGTRVQLNPVMPSLRFVASVLYTQDLTRVVFRADVDIADVFELYSAPVDGSSPALKLNTPLPAGRDVEDYFALTPDGERAVYVADQDVEGVQQLFSVPLDGSAAPIELDDALGIETPNLSGRPFFLVSPTSENVVFVRAGGTELYSAPLDGSAAPVKISAPMVAGGHLFTDGEWTPYAISPDGTHVAYVAGQDTAGKYELYCAPIDGSSAPLKLSPALAANRDVLVSQRDFANAGSPGLHFTADGQRIAYCIGINSGAAVEAYESAADGSEPARRLHPALVAGGTIRYLDLHGADALYLADQDADEVVELYSSPLDE